VIELVKQIADLQKQVDGLIKPEVPLGMSLISESLLTGSVASVTFASVPQGFRTLVLTTSARVDSAIEIDLINVRFNSDSTANYDLQVLNGNAAVTVAAAFRAATTISALLCEGASSSSNAFAPGICFIFDYSRIGPLKHTIALAMAFGNKSADADLFASLRVGGWRSTAAITQIALSPNGGGSFVTNSRFQLYGIM